SPAHLRWASRPPKRGRAGPRRLSARRRRTLRRLPHAQHLPHGLGVLVDDGEENASRAAGPAPSLLPVTHGAEAHAEGGGEVPLREAKLGARGRDVDLGHGDATLTATALVALSLRD